jgi:hypothetical protein
MSRLFNLLPLAFAGTALLSGFASAEAADNALYGAPLPDDAAFVRWLDAPEGSNRMAFGAAFGPAAQDDTAYAAVSAAHVSGAVAGGYYSIINGQTVVEPARTDATKVHLILLNADDSPARIMVADKDMQVIGDTAPGAAASRAVNPISVALAIVDATSGAELGRFDVALRRNQNITFLVHNGQVDMIQNGFGAVLKTN